MKKIDFKEELTTDLLGQYLNEIGEHALLTAEDEVRLAQQIEAGDDAAQKLEAGKLKKAEAEELRRLVRRGRKAKDAFLTANLRLVVANARRYANSSGMDFLDLVQEGNLGLIRAVEKFDWRKGFKFSTYATWWIRQAMTRGIAAHSRTVRIPVHLHDILGAVRGAQASLKASLQRDPSIEEIAEETGIDPDKVEMALEVRDTVSLDNPVGEDGALLGDFVTDADADAPDEVASRTEAYETLRASIRQLPEKGARIIALRYGLADGRPRPLKEIAAEFGLTEERIRQLEKEALRELRVLAGRVQDVA